MPTQHVPVLLNEVMQELQPRSGDIALDATLGGGGHAASLLNAVQPNGSLYGFEHDAEAIKLLQERFGKQLGSNQFIVSHSNFIQLRQQCEEWGITGKVNSMLFDLGYSSDQFERGRGFSFRHLTEPLDLRMDTSLPETAADLLNHRSHPELAKLFRDYGELQQPLRLATAVINQRELMPFVEVGHLVQAVETAYHTGSSDVLAKVWQSLRIAVNHELDHLTEALTAALSVLSPGGRLAVITFHSLEDRIVKQQFVEWSTDRCKCPPEFPVCVCHQSPVAKLLTKKPIVPTQIEIQTNSRSRSAKLRSIQKL